MAPMSRNASHCRPLRSGAADRARPVGVLPTQHGRLQLAATEDARRPVFPRPATAVGHSETAWRCVLRGGMAENPVKRGRSCWSWSAAPTQAARSRPI